MKRIVYFLSLVFIFIGFYSCTKLDNYSTPSETLKGKIIDKNTGNPMQTEAGDGGIRLKLMEWSWSSNPDPYYFDCMQDGTFNNTKIFKGYYTVIPEGAFVPLIQLDAKGDTIVNNSQTLEIQGTKDLTFEVEPFLNVEWVGDPVLSTDSTKLTVQVKVTRGTTNPNYQQNVTDIVLFINSSSPYVGAENYDSRYSTWLSGNENNSLGQVLTLTTTGNFSKSRNYYVRVGARIDVSIEGTKRFNYNAPKTVTLLK